MITGSDHTKYACSLLPWIHVGGAVETKQDYLDYLQSCFLFQFRCNKTVKKKKTAVTMDLLRYRYIDRTDEAAHSRWNFYDIKTTNEKVFSSAAVEHLML